MTWAPLSAFVRELHATARRLGRVKPSLDAARETAAEIAVQKYGLAVVAGAPELVNIAALALSFKHLVVHVLRPEIPPLVDAADLHTLPEEPPRLLQQAFVLESEWQHGHALFGDTACLGGYAVEGVVYLIGLGLGGWARVARWTPHWIGEELEATVGRDTSPLVDDLEEHGGWTREAARFVLVLGLLLDAEGSPTRITDESDRPKVPPGRSKKNKLPPAWVTRYVSIGGRHDTGAGASTGHAGGRFCDRARGGAG